jgi:pimeloyl-ACP methyl ester carboxylesterase
MGLFVLVHGGWGGGWQWRRVAARLRAQGHEVYAPTLSGLGDRSRAVEDPRTLNLSRHIDDVVQLLEFEDAQDVVLVGWSYGGAVVEGVADRVPERLRRLVNLDGELIQDGRASIDLMSAEEQADFASFTGDAATTGWVRPPTEQELAGAIQDPELRHFVALRERPQPYATSTEPFPDTGARRRQVPHTFIALTPQGETEHPDLAALRADDYWDFIQLPLNHLALLVEPDQVAGALHALA